MAPNWLKKMIRLVMSLIGTGTLSIYVLLILTEVPFLLAVLVFFTSMGVTFSYVMSRSTWFGIMVWLVYLSALLILFLFFVSLTPNPNLDFKSSSNLTKSVLLISVVILLVEVFSVSYGGVEGSTAMGGIMPMVSLWIGQGAIFMSGLAAYLFFVVVVVSKLAFRGGGALRKFVKEEPRKSPVV